MIAVLSSSSQRPPWWAASSASATDQTGSESTSSPSMSKSTAAKGTGRVVMELHSLEVGGPPVYSGTWARSLFEPCLSDDLTGGRCSTPRCQRRLAGSAPAVAPLPSLDPRRRNRAARPNPGDGDAGQRGGTTGPDVVRAARRPNLPVGCTAVARPVDGTRQPSPYWNLPGLATPAVPAAVRRGSLGCGARPGRPRYGPRRAR